MLMRNKMPHLYTHADNLSCMASMAKDSLLKM